MEVQIRWRDGRITQESSVREAFDRAQRDHWVDKISWTENGLNIRFIRDRTEAGNPWFYEPMDRAIR